jgi:hypothetical protein
VEPLVMRVAFMMRVLFFRFLASLRRSRLDGGRIGQGYRRQRLTRMGLGAVFVRVIVATVRVVVVVRMFMLVRMVMMFRIRAVLHIRVVLRIRLMFGLRRMAVIVCMATIVFSVMVLGVRVILMRLDRLGGIGGRILHHLALHPLATAAAALVAMARTAAAVTGAVLGLFLGLAMGAFVGLDQRLAVGDRDLIIVRMDFAEGEEAVTVTAIFDEGRLQRRLYARDLGEVDVAAQLLALRGFEIKLFDAVAADHNDTGLFRVGGVDQHFVGHFATHDGGGRVCRRARIAQPRDATVHLIRG